MSRADWKATGEACKVLGFSEKHLWRLRDEGLLKKGHHWRNIARPGAMRPTYRWHVKRIEKTLEESEEVTVTTARG